eukprot:jgi/Tetstr1/435499/TSEL_024403.t1
MFAITCASSTSQRLTLRVGAGRGVYVDAKGGMRLAEVLRKRGVANVACWVYKQEEVPVEMVADGSVASAFSRVFFGRLCLASSWRNTGCMVC